MNITNIEFFDPTIFAKFDQECNQPMKIMKNLTYSGGTHNGLREGKGVLYNKENQEFYSGNFSKNEYEGQGFLYFGNKVQNVFNLESQRDSKRIVVYKGEFQGGKITGEGIMKLQNGDMILGTFKDGKPDKIVQYLFRN